MKTRFIPLLLAVTTTAALVACSDDTSGTTAGTSGSSGAASGADSASFPVTFTSPFGTTTVESRPQRVVALGWSDQAVATELGADVVMAPQTYSSIGGGGSGAAGGDGQDGTAQDRMLPYLHPDTEPVWFNPMSIDVEAVAGQKPDIILATSAFTIDQDTYDKLSAVAPVVTYDRQLYAASPEDSALRIGEALGEPEKAGELVDRAHRAVEELTAALPGLKDRSYVYGQYRGTSIAAVTDSDNATARFMSTLGLVPAPEVAGIDAKGRTPGTVDLSMENIDLVDSADLLFMTFQSDDDRRSFEDSATVKRLTVMEDRYTALDKETATALQDPNVVSVPWLIEQLRPALEKVGH